MTQAGCTIRCSKVSIDSETNVSPVRSDTASAFPLIVSQFQNCHNRPGWCGCMGDGIITAAGCTLMQESDPE